MNAKNQFQFVVPCPHEADQAIPSDRMLPDHHSLTKDEIAELLDFARDHKDDVSAVSKVQVRLNQAIPGMTCPRPYAGEVAQRCHRVDKIFVNQYHLGGTPDLVEAIDIAVGK